MYDGLGRTTETRTSAPEGTIKASQQYDALGRVKRTTNPYIQPNEPTYGYADTMYDGLGRVRTVTTNDGAVVTTTYSDNATTVTDQAGKTRRSITDGLGRLIRVDEPNSSGSLGTVASPTQPTFYVYDVLDDLTTVTQGGQTRTFVYDSLKRLKQATNPESGTINYTYDANSNLQTKFDARSITTTYSCDRLNRVISRTYSDSTPSVSYKYDAQTLPTGAPVFTRGSSIGRLVAMTYSGTSAGNYTGYDQLGRVNVSYQQTDSINYGFAYAYDLASEMTSETYPSGRQVITEYDSAGRAAGIRAAAVYYAGATASDSMNRIQYASHGAVSVMKLGNGKWEHTAFDPKRLQPALIGLGTSGTDSSLLKLEYTYSNSDPSIHDNNGNVRTQKITIGSTVINQTYSYDALNRLSSASENSGASWLQTYGFDRLGNRWLTGYIVPGNESRTPPNVNAFNQSNNQIQLSGFGYDAAGNLKNDPTTPANAILYDAENRQVSFTKGGTTTYSYDGDGHRVKKIAGSVTTVFVYNASGQLAAEYTNDTTPPIGGGGTSYLTSDHLGSTRLVMKSDGTTVKARYDYLPFGEEIPSNIGGRGGVTGYGGADSTKQKFTQKERDTESGLDYFLARYYSSAQGRFTSPDPLLASAYSVRPQSWNRYAYAYNNPLRFSDPTGLDPADYYNQKGKKIGTDGADDGKVYIVTNEDTAKQIEKTKGTVSSVSSSDYVEAPDSAVRDAVGAAVERSNGKTSDDTKGGFHEEGGQWGSDANGKQVVVPAAAGAVANPQTDTQAEIRTGVPANPGDAGRITNLQGTFHIHPKGEVVVEPKAAPGAVVFGGTTTTFSFVQRPSSTDINNATTNNIVVGARDKTVYFYNHSGVRGTFPLDKFLKLGRK